MSAESRFQHVAIRASAGTGKTYALTNRVLGLLAAGCEPAHLLAVTFTRKAAGEIRQRVLQRLAEAALSEDAAHELAGAIGVTGLRSPMCAKLLTRLVQRPHQLHVSTLDGFFGRAAKAFAPELGLPAGWEIGSELGDAMLRDAAIARWLDSEAVAHLSELMRVLHGGHLRSAVTDQIRGVIGSLYPVYLEAPDAALWQWATGPGAVTPTARCAAMEALRDVNLSTDKRLANARDQDAQRFETEDWDGFLTTGIAGKLRGDGLYHKKPIPEWLASAYAPLMEHARAEILGRWACPDFGIA